MTAVEARQPGRRVMMVLRVGKQADLERAALALVPGRVTELWDMDLLTVEQAVWMHEARAAAGLEP